MSKKVIIGIGVVAILAAILVAVFALNQDANAPASEVTDTQTNEGTEPEEASAGSSEEEAGAQNATITFTNNGFSPNNLTVKKGAIITIKNDSSTQVQFSSDDHPTHRLNTEMNVRVLAPGESATFTAETVGTHGFHDHIDDRHVGMLTVTE